MTYVITGIRFNRYLTLEAGTYSSGLRIKKPTSSFCQQWMRVTHEEGSFCVEPVTFNGK